MSGKKLVIVESPTKAKTIRKYLGKEFMVESCMGHIRDLPQSSKEIPEKYKKEKWAQLGVNTEKNFEPIYCVPKNKLKVVKELKSKLDQASELYLATDEDREGESISWHLTEVLNPKVPTKRMVFNEITKEAIQKSLTETRSVDLNLVKAQEARRILDRLVGYTISPLLWKKVAFGLSAGRVQSVAVRLIVERELLRLKFKSAKYWSLSGEAVKGSEKFETKLSYLGSQRVATGKDFDGDTGQLIKKQNEVTILDQESTKKIISEISAKNLNVKEIEEKPFNRKPYAPFITSTLQQESNRKLGLSSKETMQVAQKLYEQGFITYMRTDSTFLSEEAIKAARSCIQDKFGKSYLPEAPRKYDAKKAKGAQEAHECIRPAGQVFQSPDQTGLEGVQYKLYDLIWKRTVASQMVDSIQKQVSVKLEVDQYLFSSSGMTIEFPGFLRAYVEGSDDPEAELADREVKLPKLTLNEKLKSENWKASDHETKPPARFTEASLVQTMEKEGIGRPSTYASIISTIIDRGYVKKQSNALTPTFTAMAVAQLLMNHLPQYVDLGFTSEMEKSLDNIADGDKESLDYLATIYSGKTGLKALVDSQEKNIDPAVAREIKLEGLSKYSFRVGKFGAYVCKKENDAEICASIPESECPGDMTAEVAEKLIEQKVNGNDAIGKDPKTGLPIYVLNGRYGPYVQLGDIDGEESKPKRVSIPAQVKIEDVNLETALDLLSLPKLLGKHPASGEDVKVGLGRFGPYVVCEKDFRSIPKGQNIFQLTFDQAMQLLLMPKKGRTKAAPVKELGLHPQLQTEIQVFNGPYGPYIKCGKVNASLAEGMSVESVSLEIAVNLLAAKVGSVVEPKSKKAKASTKAPAKTAETSKAGIVKKKSATSKKENPKVKSTVTIVKANYSNQTKRP